MMRGINQLSARNGGHLPNVEAPALLFALPLPARSLEHFAMLVLGNFLTPFFDH